MSRPAVVFDFDGTLIDTREIKARNYVDAVEAEYRTTPAQRSAVRESCLRTGGANRFVQLEDTLAAVGLASTEERRAAFSRRCSALNAVALRTVGEFPSVLTMLAKLGAAGYALFAASGILDEEFRAEVGDTMYDRAAAEAAGAAFVLAGTDADPIRLTERLLREA